MIELRLKLLMTPAEERFKTATVVLIHGDVYPSAKNIFTQLGHKWWRDLNGRECMWRREVCLGMGYELLGTNAQIIRASWKDKCPVCSLKYIEHRAVDCFTMRLYQSCVQYYYIKT